MECYSAIQSQDIMNFTGKWMELETIILVEGTQIQKDMHILTCKCILTIKYRMPMLYSTNPKKLNKKEGPRLEA